MLKLKKKLLPLTAVDCYLRKWKKMVSTNRWVSFYYLKYGLSLKISFHLYQWRGKTPKVPLRGKTLNKKKLFLLANKSVSTSRNEGFCLNKYFFTRREKNCHWSVTKREKNCLPLARKSVTPSKIKLSLARIFFKNWIPSNFNNGFH